ncbi:Ubiquinone/menaquinone biosynthesis C-methylase UbiE [Thermoanaerobacter thermohydrosulfuricus]|uniref:Methylase involved in ubiquinone/menaquinone biosynthesis n=3 Tax=Thermoanaerobacter TaxID=1754 RepID=I9KRU5_9THEO|nr:MULTISPECIES: class I SAM-dependent methyltransferase [Thermoanaerobacter]EGD51131.1 Methyltransferase type 11 [Thermoanaerobacter ethanolicus JW 200]EIV99510.1 methylase involved in ubiquinone/menaquinone biosynthesis [Thermoanaerobacter siderophilus SR4]EMT38242.1 Methylase involved in ubiquinone/menaquinone biosynthesis [Thermoanaerobacter thermohydrosulfuricus WC1]KHO63010.1 methyltransferase type 11 [Thermoanaerobacter sp. YS13]SDG11351.1 Ubiquinone/menaquinone biosynthesis C-methylase
MPKISAFEKHFDRYEEWFEKNEYAYQSELDAVKLLMPKFEKGLEVGIGTGKFAVPLGIKSGVEPSYQMRKIALERGLNVVDGVAENLPFEDNSFDLVLMVTTVCFVDDVLKSFKECFRVLKNSGTILIGFVDRESTIGKIYQANKEKSLFYKEATFYSTSEIVELLYEAGFKNFNFSQTIFKKLDEIKEKEPVRYGFGKGSFIVISAKK